MREFRNENLRNCRNIIYIYIFIGARNKSGHYEYLGDNNGIEPQTTKGFSWIMGIRFTFFSLVSNNVHPTGGVTRPARVSSACIPLLSMYATRRVGGISAGREGRRKNDSKIAASDSRREWKRKTEKQDEQGRRESGKGYCKERRKNRG